MAIWVTSDWHFNHGNILRFCRSQFANIEEHNALIIERYNAVVGPDDLVYVLGDVGFTPVGGIAGCVEQLKGRKVLLIGNHDKLQDSMYRKMGFISVVRHPIYYTTNIILSHVPIIECLNNPWAINVHGHLHKSYVNLPNYFNVNVELRDFAPVNMNEIVAMADGMCRSSRYEQYTQEWYAAWETRLPNS